MYWIILLLIIRIMPVLYYIDQHGLINMLVNVRAEHEETAYVCTMGVHMLMQELS